MLTVIPGFTVRARLVRSFGSMKGIKRTAVKGPKAFWPIEPEEISREICYDWTVPRLRARFIGQPDSPLDWIRFWRNVAHLSRLPLRPFRETCFNMWDDTWCHSFRHSIVQRQDISSPAIVLGVNSMSHPSESWTWLAWPHEPSFVPDNADIDCLVEPIWSFDRNLYLFSPWIEMSKSSILRAEGTEKRSLVSDKWISRWKNFVWRKINCLPHIVNHSNTKILYSVSSVINRIRFDFLLHHRAKFTFFTKIKNIQHLLSLSVQLFSSPII